MSVSGGSAGDNLQARERRSFLEILLAFLALGLTSFGGPTAHLGFFREAFVTRRRWLDEATFAEFLALCQFLPGPASSQLGMSIGLHAGGLRGALAAWLGFTLPSAILMAALGLWQAAPGAAGLVAGPVHGLKLVAVAIVAHAVLGMTRQWCRTPAGATVAAAGAVLAVLWPGFGGQLAAIALGALGGRFLVPADEPAARRSPGIPVRFPVSVAAGVLAVAGLVLLPVLAAAWQESPHVAMADRFFRSGALVFGGGHVVLPLLHAEFVPTGVVAEETFLAGYGAAQAVPGPMFTFASFLGAAAAPEAGGGIAGAATATIAIFLPSLLLVVAVLPLWQRLAGHPAIRSTVTGINAAVVGLLGAALYRPVWSSAVHEPADFAVALAGFILLAVWRAPSWVVVLLVGGGVALWSALASG